MNIGPKQLLKEITQLNLEKKLDQIKYEEIWNGDKEKEKILIQLNILVLEI